MRCGKRTGIAAFPASHHIPNALCSCDLMEVSIKSSQHPKKQVAERSAFARIELHGYEQPDDLIPVWQKK